LSSNIIVGYKRYLELVADLITGKQLVSSGMRQERERCRTAVELAGFGHTVSLISSGDSGIYGMAGLALEISDLNGNTVPIEIIPGVTASTAAAAKLGAPLMLDFACISLSDILVPWDAIRKRIVAVAAADLVVTLYNPRSSRRTWQLDECVKIFRSHRSGKTPVGIATAMGTSDEKVFLSDLDNFMNYEINMRSVLIIGNSSSRLIGNHFVTPRGYQV
jgi:precorrin-3B C17-methyltransferase